MKQRFPRPLGKIDCGKIPDERLKDKYKTKINLIHIYIYTGMYYTSIVDIVKKMVKKAKKKKEIKRHCPLILYQKLIYVKDKYKFT